MKPANHENPQDGEKQTGKYFYTGRVTANFANFRYNGSKWLSEISFMMPLNWPTVKTPFVQKSLNYLL